MAHVYLQDQDFTLWLGDATAALRQMPAESVHCCVTSPPYFALRDYGVAGQLGLEENPDAYVTALVAVFQEVRRVLRRDGTLWLNLGDSYARGRTGRDDNGVSNQGRGAGWKQHPEIGSADRAIAAGHKDKDLLGMPWRVAFALQADGWYLRSDIIWSKLNPMPESVTDRPTKAHEYLFLLTRSPRYFYDADAIREPHQPGPNTHAKGYSETPGMRKGTPAGVRGGFIQPGGRHYNPSGRNKRSVWEIATEPYPDAHFATFPCALVEPCVLAGTSERGCCPECGAPWVRDVEREKHPTRDVEAQRAEARAQTGRTDGAIPGPRGLVDVTWTSGWSPSCKCGLNEGATKQVAANDEIKTASSGPFVEPVPAVVLDPFMGSGTTALVARKLGRRSIGVELSPEYARLAADRLQQLSLLAEGAA